MTSRQQQPLLSIAPSHAKKFTTFSIDRNGRYTALGGTCLYLLDMAAREKEKEQHDYRHVPHSRVTGSVYSVLRWNPHHATLASAAGTTATVWKLDESIGLYSHLAIQGAHKRTITDLGWSPFKQYMLASRSADAQILIWDVRTKAFLLLGTGYLKWNRLNSSLIASTHYGEVMIWDLRKTSAPVITITAHTADMSDIDWAYHNESRLLTASRDCSIKIWDTDEPRTEKDKIHTGMPVARAQFTPFGDGVLSAGREDRCMRLWSLYNHLTPVHVFQDHTESIESFEWRTKSMKTNHPIFDLVSLSKDSTLNVWTITKAIQDFCRFPMSLRNQGISMTEAQDISGQAGDAGAKQRLSLDGNSNERKLTSRSLLFGESVSPSSLFSSSSSPHAGVYARNIDLKHELRVVSEHLKGVDFVEIESADSTARTCTIVLYDQVPVEPRSISAPSSTVPTSPRSPDLPVKNTKSPTSSRENTLSRGSTDDEISLNAQREMLIRMQIAFPSFYPCAQPSFTYLDGTKINQERQILLKRTLSHIGTYYSARGVPSLQKLVITLINLQRTLDAESRLEQLEKTQGAEQHTELEVGNHLHEKKEEDDKEKEATTEDDSTPDERGRQRSASFSIWERLWGRRDSVVAIEEIDEGSKDDTLLPNREPEQIAQEEEDREREREASAIWIPARSNQPEEGILESGHRQAKVDDHARQVEATPFVGSFRAPISLSSLPRIPSSTDMVKTVSFEQLLGSYDVEMSHSSNLLTQKDVHKLVTLLPPRFQMREWQLLYSTMEHGISLRTFYRRVGMHKPTVIVVEDSQKYVFGAFVTGSWEPSGKYTGTGESFLFTLSPYFRVFPWTRANELFMCGAPHSISIGGGAHVGLWLDEDFEFGSSCTCSTYNNQCLASSQDFECVVLEAWGL